MANGRVGMLQIFLYLVEGWIIYIILWWKLSENIIQNPNWWTKKFLSSNETTGRSKCHKRAFNAWAITYRRAHRPNRWRGLQLTSLITRNVTKKHLNHLWKPPTASKAKTYISHLLTQAKAWILSLSKTSEFVIGGSLASTTPVTFMREHYFWSRAGIQINWFILCLDEHINWRINFISLVSSVGNDFRTSI